MGQYAGCNPDVIGAAKDARIAELEATISALVAKEILPADAADEIIVDGVRWVRIPAEATVTINRNPPV